MNVIVNGERRQVPDAQSLERLLESLQVQTQGGVAVLLNGDVVRRADWPRTPVQPEDRLEIVRATVGGR